MPSRVKSKGKKKQESTNELYSLLAHRVLTESLQLKAGEAVTVETWDTGLECARSVVREARKLGAFPLLMLEDAAEYVFGVKNMPKDALGRMGRHEYGLLSASDAYVFIPGPPVSTYFPALTHEENSSGTAYNDSWYEAAKKSRLRGVRLTFGYVGKELAALLKKKQQDIVQLQLKASLVDLQEIKNRANAITSRLTDDNECLLTTGGAKLNFRLKGELELHDGRIDESDLEMGNNMTYMPPGMAAKSVDVASVSGSAIVSNSVTRFGLVAEATLDFEGGKVVGWKAGGNAKKILEQLFAVTGSHNLQAITLGFNPVMKLGYAQDRFVPGAVGLTGFGFTGIAKKPSLTIGGSSLVENGKLMFS